MLLDILLVIALFTALYGTVYIMVASMRMLMQTLLVCAVTVSTKSEHAKVNSGIPLTIPTIIVSTALTYIGWYILVGGW